MQSLRPRFRPIAIAAAAALALTILPNVASQAAPETPIAHRYNTNSALAAQLGAPTDNEFSVAGGSERDYKWGSLYYSSSTGVHEVHGAIWNKYKGLGGPKGFGFPTTDEVSIYSDDVYGGAENHFQKGEIVWGKFTDKTHWMGNDIANLWNDTYRYIGMPVADESAGPRNSRTVTFDGDFSAYTSSATGSYFVSNGIPSGIVAIKTEWLSQGGGNGYLGLPVSKWTSIDPTAKHEAGQTQTFQGGVVYQEGYSLKPFGGGPATKDFTVKGAIGYFFSHNSGLDNYGYPTSEETPVSGGAIQHFQHNTLRWTSANNKVTVTTP